MSTTSIVRVVSVLGLALLGMGDISSVLAQQVRADEATPFVMPQRMDTQEKLAQRMEELRDRYAAFQKDMTPPLAARQRVNLVPGEWRFHDDEQDKGFAEGFFRADFDDSLWEIRKLPEHREFARGWYRLSKVLPTEMAGRRVHLSFEGVDYHATVFVNGEKAGEHKGYFAPFSMDVTKLVRPGAENVVAVLVDNPPDSPDKPVSFQGKGQGTVAFNKENGIIQQSNAAGIWQPAYFEATGPVAIRTIRITPTLPDRVRVEVELDGDGEAEVLLSTGPANFTGPTVTAKADRKSGRDTCAFELTIPEARTWAPESPWLYFCHVTVKTADGTVSDTLGEEFGLRTITRDADGTLRLNGRVRVLRGACSFGNFWLDAVENNHDGIVRDILIFKAANLEFTRVTVHVLPRPVYRLFDRYGLMVYQDTPFQTLVHSLDKDGRMPPDMRQEAARQLREMIGMLANHPSVIIWACLNEFAPKNDRAFQRMMFDAARAADPTRPIVVTPGWPWTLEGTDSMADQHSYTGWYNRTPAAYEPSQKPYMPLKPESKGIVSEYGGVALPDWETWEERFPWAPSRPADFWTPRSILFENVYRGGGVGDRVQAAILTAHNGTPVRAADWIASSQKQQAGLARVRTDIWRKWRTHIVGYLFFHLIDPGPLVWPKTLVDCQRRPHPGYYELARASAPLRVSLYADRPRIFGGEGIEDLHLWMFNDSGRDFHGKVRLLLVAEGGKVEDEASVEVNAAEQSSQELVLRPLKANRREKREKARLVALLEDEQGKMVEFDDIPLEIFPRPAKPEAEVLVFDPKGDTLKTLESLGVKARKLTTVTEDSLAACKLFVVAENYLGPKVVPAFEVAKRGGRVVVLAQRGESAKVKDPAKAPKRPSRWSALPLEGNIKAINWFTGFVQADLSASFLRGLKREDFIEWNGDAGVICSAGLTAHPDIVPLITTGQYQAQTALGVMGHGEGQIALCQLSLVQRAAHDPMAADILLRLVTPGRVSIPARMAMSIRRARESQTQTPEAYEVTVINSGDEDGEAELFTLDDGYQQVARQSLHVAAGQRVQATVIAPLSSGKVTPAKSRGQSSLALASGSGVTIVPLKAR